MELQNQSRPAIEADPLPQPGESLHWQFLDLVFGRAMLFAMIAIFLVVDAIMDWYRYIFHVRPTLYAAIVSTILAFLGGIALLFAFIRTFKRAQALKLGQRGERHIGHYLNDLCRPLGYRVLHDIPASDFNVDHVLIGPGGVFSIETKNWSKPPKGTAARLTFDGTTLTKPDGSFDTHAVAQARANADFIRKLLAKYTNRAPDQIPVLPVLLLPGWYIEDPTPKPRPIWVLPDNTLHTFLPNEPRRLPGSDVALLYESLATYTRNFKK